MHFVPEPERDTQLPPAAAFCTAQAVSYLSSVAPPRHLCHLRQPPASRCKSRHARLPSPRALNAPTACASYDESAVPQLQSSSSASARAQLAFGALARRSKSWSRLRHLVELGLASPALDTGVRVGGGGDGRKWSIVDIGCDHGLLALALAVTGQFSSVLGVDISECALREGASRVVEKFASLSPGANGVSVSPSVQTLNLDFRLGDGLQVLRRGEADVVCIGGVGCKTMLDILTTASAEDQLLLNSLLTKRLVLQPASARPRDLVELYDVLWSLGWSVTEERIVFLGGRWYISVAFEKYALVGNRCGTIPGERLVAATVKDIDLRNVVSDWARMHCDWIQRDARQNGEICEEEKRWLEVFAKQIQHLPNKFSD